MGTYGWKDGCHPAGFSPTHAYGKLPALTWKRSQRSGRWTPVTPWSFLPFSCSLPSSDGQEADSIHTRNHSFRRRAESCRNPYRQCWYILYLKSNGRGIPRWPCFRSWSGILQAMQLHRDPDGWSAHQEAEYQGCRIMPVQEELWLWQHPEGLPSVCNDLRLEFQVRLRGWLRRILRSIRPCLQIRLQVHLRGCRLHRRNLPSYRWRLFPSWYHKVSGYPW